MHGSKLKNETSRAEAMRKKFRTGRAEIVETKAEKEKSELLKKQGRKRSYAEAAAAAKIHSQVNRANEDDNAGVNAVNAGSQAVEEGLYAVKTRPKKIKEKQTAEEEQQVSGYGARLHDRTTKTERKKDTGGSNERSRALQKKRIRKEISSKGKEGGIKELPGKLMEKAKESAVVMAEAVKTFVRDNPQIIVAAGVVLITVLLVGGAVSAFFLIAGGSSEVMISTSYTADSDDLEDVESDYGSLENLLKTEINNVKLTHPGYNEYNYSLDEIKHDPHELAALLTVLYEDFTRGEVQEMLKKIKDLQYTLTYEGRSETRSRVETRWRWVTKTDAEGNETLELESYQVTVYYQYYILNTRLKNNGLSAAIAALGLTEDQMIRYKALLETHGNKPDAFD